jgi:hypothetical protein
MGSFVVGLIIGAVLMHAFNAWRAGKFKDGVQLEDFKI